MREPEPCPECFRDDAVEPTDPASLTSDQAGLQWCCERCSLVFGHPDELAPITERNRIPDEVDPHHSMGVEISEEIAGNK